MRYPAKWNEVQENMRKAVALNERFKNLYLGWCITLSTLNITGLPRILEEHQKNFKEFGPYLNLVHGPIQYNLGQLPTDIKEYVVGVLESIPKDSVDGYMYDHHIPGIVNFIKNGVAEPSVWERFKEKTKIHDTYREQNFADVYPEYAKVIGYE
jgi:hypothetical protein